MRVLFLGDVVGNPGRLAKQTLIKRKIKESVEEHQQLEQRPYKPRAIQRMY